ncbi:MAG: hypothetical protein Q8N99_00850 [Nanoarchaeota archaeon]|nr:hypothetical protein [Nanoarchaeota archaeon]
MKKNVKITLVIVIILIVLLISGYFFGWGLGFGIQNYGKNDCSKNEGIFSCYGLIINNGYSCSGYKKIIVTSEEACRLI